MNKKEEVYHQIEKMTIAQINQELIEGVDTNTLSEAIMMDRANLSRILNELNHEGIVIKNQTRPVLYLAKPPFQKKYHSVYIPNIIPKGKSIIDYIIKNGSDNESNTHDAFDECIAYNPESSMYSAVMKAKAAMMYPEHPLNILIYGKRRTGKIDFAKSIYRFGIENHIYAESNPFQMIDCSIYETLNPDDFFSQLFGYYENGYLKHGLLTSAKKGICVLYHMEKLPVSALNRICNTIDSGYFYPQGARSKALMINCTTIGISDDADIFENIDSQLSFPITIYIPSLQERTIQEILILTMQVFQTEAEQIKNTIRVSKNILSCFVMSEYKDNMQQLRKEIRQTCAYAYYRNMDHRSIYIDIDYDDLSDYVLTHIFNINKRMDALSNILNLFEEDYFFFSPISKNENLDYLYKISQSNTISKSTFKADSNNLVMTCIEDINEASSIRLNTVRSVQIRDIYDLLYPLINQSPIQADDNLQYGLFLHLDKEISKSKKNEVTHAKESMPVKIANASDYCIAKEIHKTINDHYHILLPDIELDYIATYLYLSSQRINNNYIQVIIVSQHSDISKEYADYLNSRNTKTIVHWFNFQKVDQEEMNRFIKQVECIDRNQGVIIIGEEMDLTQWKDYLQRNCGCSLVCFQDLSIPKLISIIDQIEAFGFKLESLNIPMEKPINEEEFTNDPTTSKEFLNKLIHKLLSDSLNFLNPYKVGELLYTILRNITSDLDITYSENLLVKFLFHGSFCIERCIKNEPFSYKKTKQVINEHDSIFYIVAKNMEIANDVFNITIPDSELAMLVEIFISYTEVKER